MRQCTLVSAGVIFNHKNQILITQRPQQKSYAGYWEFPGGKIEPGETPEHALVRELHEELGMVILPQHLKPIGFVSHSYPEFHLIMPVYAAGPWSSDVHPRENQSFAWTHPDQWDDFKFLPADVELVQWLRHIWKPMMGYVSNFSA